MSFLYNNLRPNLIRGLDNKFQNKYFNDVLKASALIDEHIVDEIKHYLHLFTNEIIPTSDLINSSDTRLIKFKSRFFQLDASISILKKNSLNISYIEILSNDKLPLGSTVLEISINGVGKFKFVELYYPKTLTVNVELLTYTIKCIFETCYSWLLLKLKQHIKNRYILSNDLYSPVKISLANFNEAKNSLWFVSKVKDHVIFLLDEENINFAIQLLNNNSHQLNKSPYILLNDFIKMKLPYDKSFALQAKKANHRISGQIDFGNYFEEMTDLALSQIGVFSNDLSVYPLWTEGNIHLYGSYPAKYNTIIDPVLDANKELIIEEFLKLKSKTKRMIKQLKNQQFNLFDYGEFAGGFVGGVIKVFTK